MLTISVLMAGTAKSERAVDACPAFRRETGPRSVRCCFFVPQLVQSDGPAGVQGLVLSCPVLTTTGNKFKNKPNECNIETE